MPFIRLALASSKQTTRLKLVNDKCMAAAGWTCFVLASSAPAKMAQICTEIVSEPFFQTESQFVRRHASYPTRKRPRRV